jgi:ribosomal protein S6--L-glutamate ligase
MHLCFILEAEYQDDEMPRAVAECVRDLGHAVHLLEPHATVTELGADAALQYDAYVLKTAPDGPGLSILEAAGAAGVPTINPWPAIRLARNKAAAVAVAEASGLHMPHTFFASTPDLLRLISPRHYPLVVKPSRGSGGRAVVRVDHPDQLTGLGMSGEGHLVAQGYVENPGFDVKLYNTGQEVFAVRWPSPLHPEMAVTPRLLTTTPELKGIALAFGRAFGLKIYGVDVVASPQGWVAVDVNDFPSFREVPDAPERVAASLLRIVRTRPRSLNGRRHERLLAH